MIQFNRPELVRRSSGIYLSEDINVDLRLRLTVRELIKGVPVFRVDAAR